VRLLARRVVYQQFHLELVELASGPIQVHVGNLLRGQPLQLEQAFQIQGQVSFTPAGLTRSLGDPRWRSLADSLGETLLGIVPLGGVRIHHDKLVLTALAQGRPDPIEQETTVSSVGGSVEIRCVAGSPSYLLPMDPGITIGAARLEAGMLQLLGDARVSA
ncbi:MAG: LmeA family phospholipid-binding protein, partial [Cyanobacteria bacterium]|nr:LmeA family phospholipid-binding protein [Cyanobacteriota bacterium]